MAEEDSNTSPTSHSPLPEGFKEVKFGAETYNIKLPIEYPENVGALVDGVHREESQGRFSLHELAQLVEVEVELVMEEFNNEPMSDYWSVLTVALFTRDTLLVKAIVQSYRALIKDILDKEGGDSDSSQLRIGGQCGAIFVKQSVADMLLGDIIVADNDGDEDTDCSGIPNTCQTVNDVLCLVLQPIVQVAADCAGLEGFAIKSTLGCVSDELHPDVRWLRDTIGFEPTPVDHTLIMGDLRTTQVVRPTATIQMLKSVFGFLPVLSYDVAEPNESGGSVTSPAIGFNDDDGSDDASWDQVAKIGFSFAVQDTTKLESVLSMFAPPARLMMQSRVSGQHQLDNLASLIHVAQPPPVSDGDIVVKSNETEDDGPCPRLASTVSLHTNLFQCAAASALVGSSKYSTELPTSLEERPVLLAPALYLSAKYNRPDAAQRILTVSPRAALGFLFQSATPAELFVLKTPRGLTVEKTETRVETMFQLLPDIEKEDLMPLSHLVSWSTLIEKTLLYCATEEKKRLDNANEPDEYTDHYFELVQAIEALNSTLQDLAVQKQWLESVAAGGGVADLTQEQKFERAQKGFGKIASKHPDSLKLRFYSLFKQATIGPVNTTRPYALDMAGRAKWDAWNKLEKLSQAEAVEQYIKEYASLVGEEQPMTRPEKKPKTAGGGGGMADALTEMTEEGVAEEEAPSKVEKKKNKYEGFFGPVLGELGVRGTLLMALLLMLVLRRPVRMLTGR